MPAFLVVILALLLFDAEDRVARRQEKITILARNIERQAVEIKTLEKAKSKTELCKS